MFVIRNHFLFSSNFQFWVGFFFKAKSDNRKYYALKIRFDLFLNETRLKNWKNIDFYLMKTGNVNKKTETLFMCCYFRAEAGITNLPWYDRAKRIIYRKTPHIVPRTDRTFFFSGRYVRGTMCNSVFFFNFFGSIFPHLRPGHRPQKSFF
jgi:hypothetical protein